MMANEDEAGRRTLTNCFRRELGSREVVTTTLGSSAPAQRYSSSRSASTSGHGDGTQALVSW